MMQSPALVRPRVVVLELLLVGREDLCASGCSGLFGRLLIGLEAGILACCVDSERSMPCLSSNDNCDCCGVGKGTCVAKALVGSGELSELAGLNVLMGVPQRGQLLRVGDSGNPH